MSSLLSLPEELLAEVASLLRVNELLSFALTCSRLHRHVQDRLEKNSQLHKVYRVQHDRLPLNVPTLLRLALSATDDKWHVRTFESWGIRPGFHQWLTLQFAHGERATGPYWPDPDEDYSDLSSDYFSMEEYALFQDVMANQLGFSEFQVNLWKDRISDGWDEPLKGLLFSNLPELKRLNLISFRTDDFENSGFHPLGFLNLIINNISDSINTGIHIPWPPGLLSLREICVSSNTPYRHPHDAWYPTTAAVAPLFKLPNLKILNLGLVGLVHPEIPESWDLAPQSSSVEDLSFYVSEFSSLRSWERFIRAPVKLRKFYTEFCSPGDRKVHDMLCELLAAYHHETLEELWLDGPYQVALNRSEQSFSKLKMLGFFRDTNLLQTQWSPQDISFRPQCFTNILPMKRSRKGNRSATYQIADLCLFLPSSIEVLWLKVDSTRYLEGQRLLSNIAIRSEILRAIANMVEDPRFSSIREVCLYGFPRSELERPQYRDSGIEEVKHEWDWDALQRIHDKGIETHLYSKDGKALTHEAHYKLHTEGRYRRDILESDPLPAKA